MKNFSFYLSLLFFTTITHAQNYTLTFAATGASNTIDSVHVQNLTQCTDTTVPGGDVLNLSSTVGIKTYNDEANTALNIFPNPSAGSCIANLEAPANSNTTIEIYDAIGKRIALKQQFLAKGNHAFNIQGISSGVYLFKIQSEKYTCTAKLLSTNKTEGNLLIAEIPATSQLPTGKIKGAKNTIGMLFYAGDTLKLTGYFGIYKTVMVLMPTQDQTVTFNFIPCTDADGNNYSVVQIGTQIWMGENLNATHYSNGDPVPNVIGNTQWGNLTTGAYCYYNNDVTNAPIYGALYNWYAAGDARNICPTGWHVPTDDEWIILGIYLDTTKAGTKLKEKCSNLWYSTNAWWISNESGFSARPGGLRGNFGMYGSINEDSDWWSSTEVFDPPNFAWSRYLFYIQPIIDRNYVPINGGLGMRCIIN